MNPICRQFALLALLLSAAWVSTAQAEDEFTAACAAILRGDYETGRAELARLQQRGIKAPDAERVTNWLERYREAFSRREQMKRATFDWNVQKAQQALADGQLYFALSFAAQAASYATDEEAFSSQPWVRELTAKVEEEAARLEEAQRWTRVHSYYVLLKRLHPKNKDYERRRQQAERVARLELLYKNKKELERRIQDVNKDLLRNAIRLIHKNYYREPDFQTMAAGALDNLMALASTAKLHEFLHGLGNPVTRTAFVDGLKQLRETLPAEDEYDYRELLKLYNRVSFLNAETVELPEALLVVEFLEGALRELDEYTSVIWPVDAPDFDKMMIGGFEGVGIQLNIDERTGRLKVVTPLEDSPALEAGVQPDDLIIEVNGQSTKGWSTEDAVRNIMGPAGTEVTLTMFRPSTGERLTFRLKRRNIVLKTVRGVHRLPDDPQKWNYILDEESGIAYIRVTGFHPETQDELIKALRAAEQQGMRALILDLRHNPGGLLDVAVQTVSTFVSKGEVVSTGGRYEPRTSIPVSQEPYHVDVPVVVLVNEGSASASEILAGAFQDHHRAIVLGERTFGKGSVQRVMPLGNKARLKLTTALYYLPSGRSPYKDAETDVGGITPDVEVKLTPKEFRQVLKRETESYVIHNEAAAQSQPSPEEREKALEALKDEGTSQDEEPPLLSDEQIKALEGDPVQPPQTDAQLDTALLLLRVKLASNIPWPQQLAARIEPAAVAP